MRFFTSYTWNTSHILLANLLDIISCILSLTTIQIPPGPFLLHFLISLILLILFILLQLLYLNVKKNCLKTNHTQLQTLSSPPSRTRFTILPCADSSEVTGWHGSRWYHSQIFASHQLYFCSCSKSSSFQQVLSPQCKSTPKHIIIPKSYLALFYFYYTMQCCTL